MCKVRQQDENTAGTDNGYPELFLPESVKKKRAFLLVGLSGGADSVALTHLLLQMGFREMMAACHVNHLLRGEESERDMTFVQNLCREWGISCYCCRTDVKALSQKQGMTLEECGREERYRIFRTLAEKLKEREKRPVWIVTAHTLSDDLETVLFRFARGSGLRGLCGIPLERENIARPLLGWRREEIERYCRENQLEFVTDSSNLSNEYNRNKIRHIVVPALREINPGLEKTFFMTHQVLREENDYLTRCGAEEREKRRDGVRLNVSGLEKLHPVLRKRMWDCYLREYGISPSFSIFSWLEDMLLKKQGKLMTSRIHRIVWQNDRAWVEKAEEEIPYFEKAAADGTYVSKTGKVYKIQTLSISSSQSFHKVYKNLFDIFIDCDKIYGNLVIRQKKDGDRIRLSYRGCTKSLKKLFQEAGISPEERKKRFVLADESGVVAVEGFGVDERAVCDKSTTRLIAITEKENIHHE
jgi:tRNA(Ile)-lysidine synthase